MAGEWRHARLGDVIELKRGYDLPASQRHAGNVPIVSSSGANGSHNEAKVNGPGVVTGRYGTIGEVFYVEEDFWPLNTTLYVKDFKGSVPRFVSYFLQTFDFRSYSDKAAVPGVNRNHLHEAEISWPDRSKQELIAALLGALDDKIELNQQMIATLEVMAQATFASWFVDFDPVRLKAEGISTSNPDALEALFPNRFGENGLPLGWTSEPIGTIARIIKGSSYKSEHLTTKSETALVTLKSFRRGGGYRVDGLKRFSGPYKPAQQVKPGELIIAATDVTQAADVVGQPMIVQPPDQALTLVASLDTFIVRPHAKSLTPVMLEGILRASAFPAFARGYCTGTTVLHLSARAFEDFLVPLPPAATLIAMADMLTPLYRRQELALRQSHSLVALRDALLPKLVSGELRIHDVEARVAAA